MAEPTTEDLTALAESFIRVKYARLSKEFETPTPALSDAATAQLRTELEQALLGMEALGRSKVANATFTVTEGRIVETTSTALLFTCTETYKVSYESVEWQSRSSKGAWRHKFTVGTDAGELVIEAHECQGLTAQDLDAEAARKSVADGVARKTAVMEKEDQNSKAKSPKEKSESDPSARNKLIFALIGILLGGGFFCYNFGPRTETTEFSLYTGQSRVKETRVFFLPTGSTVKDTNFSTWAVSRMPVSPSDDKWITLRTKSYSWFSDRGTETSNSDQIVEYGMRNLLALKSLDDTDKAAADAAILRYQELVAGLDVNDPTIVPTQEEMLASKGKASTPFASFSQDLGKTR